MTAKSCSTCDSLMQKYRFRSPEDYSRFVRSLEEYVSENKLKITSSHNDLKKGPLNLTEWQSSAGDSNGMTFKCRHCSGTYELHVDWYHGGGEWKRT